MKLYLSIFLFVSVNFSFFNSCSDSNNRNRGFDYPDNDFPGKEAKLFAPNLISSKYHEHSAPAFIGLDNSILWYVVFTPGQSNFIPKGSNLQITYESGKWTKPKFVKFLDFEKDFEGCFTPDGKEFYFGSIRSCNDKIKKNNLDIWFVSKLSDRWSKPVHVSGGVNTKNNEQQPTISQLGNLYYVGYWEGGANNYGIYRARTLHGYFSNPELLSKTINSPYVDWTPFIDPEERFLLFSSNRPTGYGDGDIYISYKQNDDSWSDAINLGPSVNTEFNELFPSVSPDGNYLYFLRNSVNNYIGKTYNKIDVILASPGNGYNDIYWIKINGLFRL